MTRAFTSFRRNSFSLWMLCVQDWKEMGETGGQQLSWPSLLPSPTLQETPAGAGVASAKESDPAADQKSPCRPRAFSYLKLIQLAGSDPCT